MHCIVRNKDSKCEMSINEFEIVTASRADRLLAIKWVADEDDWNHGDCDYDIWIRVLPLEQFIAIKLNNGIECIIMFSIFVSSLTGVYDLCKL
jgi:hypothetical protein